MKHSLFTLSAFAFVVGALAFLGAFGAVQKIGAFMFLLISAVLFSGGAIVDAIGKLR